MRVADWYDAQTMRLSENSHFQAVDWSLVHCQTTTEWDSRPTITHPTLISIHTHPIPLILSTTGLFLSRRVISPIVGSHHKHDYHQRSDGTPTIVASIVSCRCRCVELSFSSIQHNTTRCDERNMLSMVTLRNRIWAAHPNSVFNGIDVCSFTLSKGQQGTARECWWG